MAPRRRAGQRVIEVPAAPNDVLLISDPSYPRKSPAAKLIPRCAPGEWVFSGGYHEDERVEARMQLIHRDFDAALHARENEDDDDDGDDEGVRWEPLMGRIGRQRKDRPLSAVMDTAQIGVWVASLYPEETGDYDDSDSFYAQCCGNGTGYVLQGNEVVGALVKATSDGDLSVYLARDTNSGGRVVGVRLGDGPP
jgi:hypothetical protein